MSNNNEIQLQIVDTLFDKISIIIDKARRMIVSTINTNEVYTKFEIGRYIVETEQQGEYRAQYGKHILKNLSEKLTSSYGNGWSYSNLRQIRQFYITYCNLTDTVCQIENDNYNSPSSQKAFPATINDINPNVKDNLQPHFSLSWSHYLILMRINNNNERRFYEIECARQMWSVRQLSRQVNSSLYERLALSRNKNDVMRLATEGQVIEKATDIIKNPITLEFLGLKPDVSYSENKLESSIIGKMQQFLLELGKGFLFEARQKRFTFDEQHFYVDLFSIIVYCNAMYLLISKPINSAIKI